MPSFKAELASYLEQHPDTQYIDTLLPDINGIPRGKRLPRSAFKKLEQGCYMPCSVFSMDMTGDVIEKAGLGQEIGEPDKLCLPIAGSLCPSASDPDHIAQVLMTMIEDDNTPFVFEPRNQLAALMRQFTPKGLQPVVALELEFYLIDPQRTVEGGIQPPLGFISGQRENASQVYSVDGLTDFADFLNDINTLAQAQGIPVDAAVAEAAPGQFEINLKHTHDPLAACDHAILLKRLIKTVAQHYNYEATFMAKPYEAHAGNGLHIHTSLLDQEGNNTFVHRDGSDSIVLQQAIAGAIELMPESIALLCPNVNSYRRLVPDMYVPLQACWGHNNRTVSLRIPASDPQNRRIEYRLAGADANPYLTLAAVLSGFLHGLDHQLTPPPETQGNGANQDLPLLPHRPGEALKALSESQYLERYIRREYLDLYALCKNQELEQFERHITRLEMDWCLANA